VGLWGLAITAGSKIGFLSNDRFSYDCYFCKKASKGMIKTPAAFRANQSQVRLPDENLKMHFARRWHHDQVVIKKIPRAN